MAGQEEAAQEAADRLALALEEVGFDVGLAFPMLAGVVGRDGTPHVELGRVNYAVAARLTEMLEAAAQVGSVGSEDPEAGR